MPLSPPVEGFGRRGEKDQRIKREQRRRDRSRGKGEKKEGEEKGREDQRKVHVGWGEKDEMEGLFTRQSRTM